MFSIFSRGASPVRPQMAMAASILPGDTSNAAAHDLLRFLTLNDPETGEASPQALGWTLFTHCRDIVRLDAAPHPESLVGLLAALGGFSCAVAACDAVNARRGPETDRDFHVVEGANGHRTIFGDLPNRLLLDAPTSLLQLALDAVRRRGVDIAGEDIGAALRHAANAADFAAPRTRAPHAPAELPMPYVQRVWPDILRLLQRADLPTSLSPSAFGFALQHAIEDGTPAIDPASAALITLDYAIPMAKIEPSTVPGGDWGLKVSRTARRFLR